MGVLVWHILPLVYLLMPDMAAFPGHTCWHEQLGQIPKAVATLTSKDQIMNCSKIRTSHTNFY